MMERFIQHFEIRTMGSVNWLGFCTLLSKETRRFLKVYFQTIIAPMVTTLLFLSTFLLSVGRGGMMIHGLPYVIFLAPGLIMMAITQNSFANTSSSIIIAKVQGNIVDSLMPPLNAIELTVAFALGGVARGLTVGIAVGFAIELFVGLPFSSIGLILYHALMGSLMLSLLGLMAGIWADKFDHMAAITNFIITPLSFLSGTFYSIEQLPKKIYSLALLNPFFYMIDGFRAGFTGQSESVLWIGVIFEAITNLALLWGVYAMFSSGYKLKA